ncbi:MAG: HAD family hydrolase [Candidatus Symbiothrix sp.]|jgi:hydroxymethylpyrimidine pyrophosphatase-like HAD family hydrolase|nr:HAD family hydrolase [Candidatus Symbiothrix sp.]
MIVAIDFEGTLHDGKYPVIGNPQPHAIAAMQKISNNGHRIIITTCRPIRMQDAMIKWLEENKIPYDTVNDNFPEIKAKFDNPRKIYADIYIDNKNILGLPPWNLVYDLLDNKPAIMNLHRYLPCLIKK